MTALAHVTSQIDAEGNPTDDVLAPKKIVLLLPVRAAAAAAAKPRRRGGGSDETSVATSRTFLDDDYQGDRTGRDYARSGRGPGGGGPRGSARDFP